MFCSVYYTPNFIIPLGHLGFISLCALSGSKGMIITMQKIRKIVAVATALLLLYGACHHFTPDAGVFGACGTCGSGFPTLNAMPPQVDMSDSAQASMAAPVPEETPTPAPGGGAAPCTGGDTTPAPGGAPPVQGDAALRRRHRPLCRRRRRPLRRRRYRPLRRRRSRPLCRRRYRPLRRRRYRPLCRRTLHPALRQLRFKRMGIRMA